MSLVVTVLHVFVCIFLIAVVLLQRGKGAEIGAVFGSGASSTVFGGRGAGNFLTKLTTVSAIIFMITSLSLAYLWTSASEERLFEEAAAEALADEPLFEDLGTVAPETSDESTARGIAEEAAEAPVEGIGIEDVPEAPAEP